MELSREYGLSRRQAYRYLELARAGGPAAPVVENSITITLKMPKSLAGDLRAHASKTSLRQARLSGGRCQHSSPRSADMVERQQIRRSVQLEFAFDRLRAAKLEQAYDILVPDRVKIVGGVKMAEKDDEDRGDLRSCIVGQTKGREPIASQTAALIRSPANSSLRYRENGYSKTTAIAGQVLSVPASNVCAILPPRD